VKISLEERTVPAGEHGRYEVEVVVNDLILFCGSCINTSVERRRLRDLARVYVDSVAGNWVESERRET